MLHILHFLKFKTYIKQRLVLRISCEFADCYWNLWYWHSICGNNRRETGWATE